MKKIILFIGTAILLIALFSFKLLEVPSGLTLDEADFGYNAAVLAQTGRDANHRLLPFFVLSSSGTDWRQPFTQYYLAGLFRIFGPSVFLLRLSSVLIIVGSVFAMYFLGRKLFGARVGFLSALVFATIPLIMIQSHMALDNIMPIPFTLLWIWLVSNFLEEKKTKWLIMMGVVLGASLYSYKGMRAVAPVWVAISGLLILTDDTKKLNLRIKRSLIFGLSVLPFFLIMPWLEKHYAGSIFGGSKPVYNNIYDLLLPYMSSFDISNLFITGDIVSQHSTGIHGVYLLASAPWFFVGIFEAVKRKSRITILLLVAFLFGPLLFGLVGSIHRFSRLLMMAPIYSLITALGVESMWQSKLKYSRLAVAGGLLLMAVNFGDFVRNYWYVYPGITQSLNGTLMYYQDYKKLAELAKAKNLKPISDEATNRESGVSGKFFQMIYFGKLLPVVGDGSKPTKEEILITPRNQMEKYQQLNDMPVSYRIFVAN